MTIWHRTKGKVKQDECGSSAHFRHRVAALRDGVRRFGRKGDYDPREGR
jgi:hypothetical protein